MIFLTHNPLLHHFTPSPLNIAHAYVNDHPIRVLFDEGSQVNMINSQMIELLCLSTQQLTTPIVIRGANAQLSTTTTFVPKLSFRVSACTSTNTSTDIHFHCQPLVTSSPFDLLLGISFIKHHNLVHHHCNNTLIYISDCGDHLTIPLLHSKATYPCRHRYCPFLDLSSSVVPTTPLVFFVYYCFSIYLFI